MSRTDARTRSALRRPSRAVAASLLALLLLAAGVVVAIIFIGRLATGVWLDQAELAGSSIGGWTWDSAEMLTAGAVIAVVGLAALLAALLPGSMRTAALRPAVDVHNRDDEFVVTTGSLARLAADRAEAVSGVDKVSVWATDSRVDVRVTTTSEQTETVRGRVTDSVTQALRASGLATEPRVSVRVQQKELR